MAVYYPPIPNSNRGRGRPSSQEMAERKKYWDSNGGPPKSTQPVQPVNKQIEKINNLLSSNVVKSKRAEPVKNNELDKNESIPDDIKKIIDDFGMQIPSKEKSEINKLLAQLPPAKRGRPSVEYLEAKNKIKSQINDIVVRLVRGVTSGSITAIPVQNNTSETQLSEVKEIPLASIPGFQQYKFGDQVYLAKFDIKELQGRKKPRRAIGVVSRHDIGSAFVFVYWNGMVKDWCHVSSLKPFKATKEDIDEITSESSSDDDGDEE